MARSKKPTKAELRLLKAPPTRETWYCVKCINMPINGSLGECWLCRTPKPQRPKLMWPVYVRACEKVGHDPTERTPWPLKEKDETDAPKRGISRKTVARRSRPLAKGTRS